MCTTLFKCQVFGSSYRIVKDDSNELVPFIVEYFSTYRKKYVNLPPVRFVSYSSAVTWLSKYIYVKFLGAAYASESLKNYHPRFDFPYQLSF